MLSILPLYLILMPARLKDHMIRPEIFWCFCQGFCHSKDKKLVKKNSLIPSICLTLKENPHFYVKLPSLLKAHGDSLEINPTEDFQQADRFYVLTDRQEPIHIMTGNKILHSFSNVWCYNNTTIFKGSCNHFFLPLFLTF